MRSSSAVSILLTHRCYRNIIIAKFPVFRGADRPLLLLRNLCFVERSPVQSAWGAQNSAEVVETIYRPSKHPLVTWGHKRWIQRYTTTSAYTRLRPLSFAGKCKLPQGWSE